MKQNKKTQTALFYAGAMTYAQKGKRLLEQNGIAASIERTRGMVHGGCSYSLRVAEQSYPKAAALLKNAGIGRL